jgi:large repetitive protein
MAQNSNGSTVTPAKNIVKVNVLRANVKQTKVIDTDIVFVLEDGRTVFIRDGAVQSLLDNGFSVEFSDGDLASGQELLQSAGAAEISSVALTGPQASSNDGVIVAQAPQAVGTSPVAQPSSGGGLRTWLAVGTPLVGGVLGGVLGGGGSSTTADTATPTNVKPATPVINVISENDQVNAADKARGVEIGGTAEANASVTVIWGTVTKTATANASGIWSVTYATGEVPADALGTTVSATVRSTAGVSSDPASRTVQIDSKLPEAPVVAKVTGDDIVGPSEKTNGVEVSGTAEANSSVEVTWGTVTKIAQADRVGNWRAQFAAGEVPPTGTSNVRAIATDAFGNTSNAAATSVVISPAVTITGQVTAGPLQAGHGLTVDLYRGDGTLLVAGIKPGADGVFTASGLPVGVGDVVIARVNDTTAGGDYLDEATGLPKDLNAVLIATKAIGGVNETLNITPITTIAAIKAGLASDGTGTIANAASATNANLATASALGLAGIDITTTRAITTDSTSYVPSNGLNDNEKIGAILAAMSGADKANGGDVQATINILSQQIQSTGAVGTLTSQGQLKLMEGAAQAENLVPGSLQNLISDVVAAAVPAPKLTINAIATDNIVTADETSGFTISGTVTAGASAVSVALGTRTVAAVLSGTNWTYQASASDIAALGADGPKQVQATATFADNSSATASRLFSLKATPPALPVFTRIAGDTENFAVNTTERGDGFAVVGTGDPGSTILVALGSVTKSSLADANGGWSVTFERLELPTADGSYDVTARAQDAFGNVTAPVTRKLSIDTASPTLLTFSQVTGDNRIGPNDTSAVRFEGTAELGAVVRVVFDGKTYTGVATSTNPLAVTGTWSIPLPASQIPADSIYEAVATVFDAAGNQGVTVRQNVTVDISPPARPTVDIVAGDDNVNKAERDNPNGIIISGKAEAGTLVELSWGGKSYTPVRATSRGTYSFQLTAANSEIPIDGSYPISVVAVDSSGNRSEIGTRPGPVIVDTATLPVVITKISGDDDKINLADRNGSFTVEGEAEKGAFVTVKVGDMIETTNAGVLDGKWSVTFTPTSATENYLSGFPLDTKTLVVTAESSDLAGNASQQATRVAEVDTVAPDQPTIALVSDDDAINAVDGSSSVTISGTAEPNSKVTIDWGSRVVGQVRDVDDEGKWFIIVSPGNIPDEGTANIIVRATDAAGNISVPSLPRPVTIDKSTSVATIDAVGGDDNIINNAERSNAAGVAITGRAEANGRVEVTIGSQRVNANVDSEGDWRAVFLTGQLPGAGTHTVFVRSFDRVGNEAPLVAQRGFTVDLLSTTPNFTGTITPAGAVRLADDIVNFAERDGGIVVTGEGEVDGTAFVTINGITLSGPVSADQSWAITFRNDQLPETFNGVVSVYVVDKAGNISATVNKPLIIDTTAPGKVTFNNVAVDNVINRAERDDPNGVNVTGSAEGGARVFVRWGPGGVLKEANADANGVWTANFLGTEMNASGATNIIAYQVDRAGNIGAEEFRPVTVATGAPPAPGINTTILGGDYTVNIAEYTSMIISGTGVAGNKVRLSWGNINNLEETVTAQGTWSFTIAGSAVTTAFDATTTLSVRQVDSEGNISVAATTPQPIIFDRTRPAVTPIITAPLNTNFQNDDFINATERPNGLTLSGTAAGGANRVYLSWRTGSTDYDEFVTVTDGAWVYTIDAAELPSGSPNATVTFSARAVDAAGNQSAGAATQSYTFDGTAPSPVTNVSFATDNIVNLAESQQASLLFRGNLAANHGAKKIIVVWNNHTESLDLASETSSVTGWEINWARTNLPDTVPGPAQIFTEDAAGNRTLVNRTITNNRTPAPELTNVLVADDDKINLTESEAATIRVTGGGASVGATVFVNLGGVLGQTTVAAGGNWTVDVSKTGMSFAGSSLPLSVFQRNTQGNDSPAVTKAIGVDIAPPSILTLNNVATDNRINKAEAEQSDSITLTGATDPGITSVVVSWGTSTTKPAVVTTTGGTATWSASFNLAERGAPVDGTPVRITVVATDDYGNAKTTIRDIPVDTSPPTSLVLNNVEGADNSVNSSEVSDGVTISGVADVGAPITVNWGGRTQSTTASDGTWSVFYGSDRTSPFGVPNDGASVALSVTQEDIFGNIQTVNRNIRIDTSPPAAPTLLGVSNDYGTALDGITSQNGNILVGTGAAGEFVDIAFNGSNSPVRVQVNSRGIWTYEAPELKGAAMASTVTLAGRAVDGVGNVSGALTSFTTSNFTSVQRQAQAVTPIEVASLTALPTDNVTTPLTGIQIRGARDQDRMGTSVSVGDVDNDGDLDLIIGSRNVDNIDWNTNSSNGLDFGETYVIYGRADWSLQTTPIDVRNLGTAGYAIRGEAGSDQFGSNVAFLGDVNNDNRGDIAVFANNGDNPAAGLTELGALYVFFSSENIPGVLQTNAGQGSNRYTYSASSMDKAAGFVFRGLSAAERPGIGVVGAKLNGDDNVSDIAIGINGYDRPSSTGLSAVNNIGAVAVILGRNDGNYTSVAATERQNLDINSLVAPGSLAPGQAGAEGFLIRGSSGNNDAGFGQTLGTGDFNNDGLADLIIGSPIFDVPGGNNAGAAYVIFGKATKEAWNSILTDDLSRPNAGGGSGFGKVLDVANLAPTDGFRISGEAQTQGTFGTSVQSAGDINGDGIEDMIIGAQSFDVGTQVDAGSAYVVFGRAGTRANLDVTNLTASDGFIIRGAVGVQGGVNGTQDAAGATAVGVGDVNGDGYADIVVTAPGVDHTVNGTTTGNWGAAYLVLGRAEGSVYGSLVAGRSILNLADFGPGDGVMYVGRAGSALLGGAGTSGAQVTAAGDLNKDGFADFVINSPEASVIAGRPVGGESYIIFGSAGLGGMTRTGTPDADTLIGGTFNDTISGLGGLDNILTFDGNDTITVPDLGFNFIDGGAGIDTLRLAGSGDILNVRSSGGTNNALSSGKVAGIERIDLTGAGNNTLDIDVDGLLQLSSDLFDGGNGAERLMVTGDAGDIVNATGFGATAIGTQTINGVTYNIFSGTGTGNAAAQLWVQNTVTVEVTPPPISQQMWTDQMWSQHAVLAA